MIFCFYEYDVINYNFYYVILLVHIVGLCNNLYAFRIREESYMTLLVCIDRGLNF